MSNRRRTYSSNKSYSTEFIYRLSNDNVYIPDSSSLGWTHVTVTLNDSSLDYPNLIPVYPIRSLPGYLACTTSEYSNLYIVHYTKFIQSYSSGSSVSVDPVVMSSKNAPLYISNEHELDYNILIANYNSIYKSTVSEDGTVTNIEIPTNYMFDPNTQDGTFYDYSIGIVRDSDDSLYLIGELVNSGDVTDTSRKYYCILNKSTNNDITGFTEQNYILPEGGSMSGGGIGEPSWSIESGYIYATRPNQVDTRVYSLDVSLATDIINVGYFSYYGLKLIDSTSNKLYNQRIIATRRYKELAGDTDYLSWCKIGMLKEDLTYASITEDTKIVVPTGTRTLIKVGDYFYPNILNYTYDCIHIDSLTEYNYGTNNFRRLGSIYKFLI